MQYKPLKTFVARHGGTRLAMHTTLRDQLVDMAVQEFPVDAPDDKKAEVLAARLRVRVREKYGSFIVTILVGIVVNLVCRIIVEWWKKHHSHQVLMYGWHAEANTKLEAPRPDQAG
jgi:hypothetical protein